MRRLIVPFFLLLATTASPGFAQDAVSAFAQLPVEDADLSEMRGGFGLPGGLQVAIAVQSDTRVNGLLMLRSVFVVDQGAPELSVFGRTDGSTAASGVVGGGSTTSISVSSQTAPVGGAAEGLRQLAVTPGGAAVATDGGSVHVDRLGAGNQVVLSGSTLDVSHLAGQAYGSIVANRGNDVTIDTVTNINIDLKNTLPSNIGSAMFRVEALAIDSATRMGR